MTYVHYILDSLGVYPGLILMVVLALLALTIIWMFSSYAVRGARGVGGAIVGYRPTRLTIIMMGAVAAAIAAVVLLFFFGGAMWEAVSGFFASIGAHLPEKGTLGWLFSIAAVLLIAGALLWWLGFPDSDQLGTVLFPFVVAAIILFVFPALFPGFSARYVAEGGPVFLLLVLLALMALVALVPWKLPRKLAMSLLTIMLLISVVPAAWEALPWDRSAPGTYAAARGSVVPKGVDESLCDGRKRIYTLTDTNTLILGGARCKMVEWGRDKDVVLYGGGRETLFPAGAGGNGPMSTHWRCAHASTCDVTAYFCRPNDNWDSVNKTCRRPI